VDDIGVGVSEIAKEFVCLLGTYRYRNPAPIVTGTRHLPLQLSSAPTVTGLFLFRALTPRLYYQLPTSALFTFFIAFPFWLHNPAPTDIGIPCFLSW